MRKIFLFIYIVSIFAIDVYSKIVTTASLNKIEAELEVSDKDTLVIFDCDDVLIRKVDCIFEKKNVEYLSKIFNPSCEPRYKKLKGIIKQTAKNILVNKKIPQIIKDLQEHEIKVLVVTSMTNERLGDIDSIDIRVSELKEFGLDFSKSWKGLKSRYLGQKGNSSYYSCGVVCAKPFTKGKAIRLFLKYAKKNPKKIIFIDDSRRNIDEVEITMKKLGIDAVCVEYTKCQKVLPKLQFLKERVNFQVNYLKKHNIWISDEEAENMMK